MLRKIISLVLVLSLFSIQSGLAEVGQLNLSNYLHQGPKLNQEIFRSPVLRYFSYDTSADNFQLLLDPGSLKDKLSESEIKGLAKEQLDYFLVGLTLPNSKFWVNLRPDAPENIIEPELEQTEVGRIMLEADLQLKKDTALWTSPQTKEGRVYWDKLYEKAKELFGTEPANIPTITRPWIVPGEILIREDQGAASTERSRSASTERSRSAYVYKATLKVMLEEDYLKSSQLSAVSYQQYTFKDSRMKELNVYSSQLIRELILPKLTQEVNSGQNYASLRQVYFSLVLSRWFKQRFGKPVSQLAGNPVNPLTGKPANLSQLIDSGDLSGLTSKQPWSKETYFKEYQKSFSQGEYNLKEQVTTPTGQVIRSYVSGGENYINLPVNNGFSSNQQNVTLPRGLDLLNGNGKEISLSASPLSAQEIRGRIKEIKKEIGRDIFDKAIKFTLSVHELFEEGELPDVWSNTQSAAQKKAIEYEYNILRDDSEWRKSLSNISHSRDADNIMTNKLDRLKKGINANLLVLSAFEDIIIDVLENQANKKSIWQRILGRDNAYLIKEIAKQKTQVKQFFDLNRRKLFEMDNEVTSLFSRNEFTELEQRTEELRDLLSKYASATGDLLSLQKLIERLPKRLIVNTDRSRGYDTEATIKKMINEGIKILQKASLVAAVKYEVESEPFVSLEALSSFIEKIISSLNNQLNDIPNKRLLSDIEIYNLSEEEKEILGSFRKTIALLSEDFQELKAGVDSSPFFSQPMTKEEIAKKLEEIGQKVYPFFEGLVREFEEWRDAGEKSGNFPYSRIDRLSVQPEYTKFEKQLNEGWGWFKPGYGKYRLGLLMESIEDKIKVLTREIPTPDEKFFEEEVGIFNKYIKEIQLFENKVKKEPRLSEIEKKYVLVHLQNAYRILEEDVVSKLNTMKKVTVKEKVSSALNNQQITREQVPSGRVLGGIDFTEIDKYMHYDGIFKGIDLSLPLLSQAELERLDPQQEQEALDNQLLNVKVPANDDRLMRHLSGVFEKGQFSQLQPELIRYAQELCNFLEAKGLETTPRQRAFIFTADTGIFIRQPAQYSPN